MFQRPIQDQSGSSSWLGFILSPISLDFYHHSNLLHFNILSFQGNKLTMPPRSTMTMTAHMIVNKHEIVRRVEEAVDGVGNVRQQKHVVRWALKSRRMKHLRSSHNKISDQPVSDLCNRLLPVEINTGGGSEGDSGEWCWSWSYYSSWWSEKMTF